jgi:hypothetical protein
MRIHFAKIGKYIALRPGRCRLSGVIKGKKEFFHHSIALPMSRISWLAALAAAFLLFTGCASWQQNKWLAAHRSELQRLAESNLSAEQKMDGLIKNYVRFMNEGLQFANPVKGVKYVRKYHDQNQGSIDRILRDAERWQGKLDGPEKIALAVRLAQKPYIGELVDLAPKFKRKYQQYAFIVQLTSKITGGFGKLAGKIF